MSGDLYRVDVGYFCAGVIVEAGVVREAAPVLRWAIGKPFADLSAWVRNKRGKIIPAGPSGEGLIAR